VSLATDIQQAQPICSIAVWGLSGSITFFPHYLTNGKIFGKKKLLNTKCVFRFSPQLLF